MAKEKDILEYLEKEIREVYEILLRALSKIKDIINALKSKREGLRGYAYRYIQLYKMARGIRFMLAALDKRVKEDSGLELKIREDEEYLDSTISQYKLTNIVKIKKLVEYYSRWGNVSKKDTMNEISRLFEGLEVWQREIEDAKNFAREHKETLEEHRRLGIIHLHHEFTAILIRFMIKLKIILNLLRIERGQLRKIDKLINTRLVPLMKQETELIKSNERDRRVVDQALIIERYLRELESLV